MVSRRDRATIEAHLDRDGADAVRRVVVDGELPVLKPEVFGPTLALAFEPGPT